MNTIEMNEFIVNLMRQKKEEMIEMNRDLLTAFLGTIPAGNRIQNIPNLATLRTMKELDEIKTFVENVYGGGPLWPVGTFAGWRVLAAAPAPVLAQTDEQKGETLAVAFVRENTSALSFAYLNPDVHANDYAMRRMEHTQGLKEKHAALLESKLVPRRKFLDDYKAARLGGSTASVLDCMSPQVQTQVMTQLSINFTECKEWFQRSVSTIDEGDFLKYFLLLCATMSKADELEIIAMLKEIRMADPSMDAYTKYDSEFWYMLQTIKGNGSDPFSQKRVAELHAAGLRGDVQGMAKEAAKSVDKDLHGEYLKPVADYMEGYRTSHPTIALLTKKLAAAVAEKAGGRGGGWRDEGGRGGGGRGGSI
jgi:hypothetical protein